MSFLLLLLLPNSLSTRALLGRQSEDSSTAGQGNTGLGRPEGCWQAKRRGVGWRPRRGQRGAIDGAAEQNTKPTTGGDDFNQVQGEGKTRVRRRREASRGGYDLNYQASYNCVLKGKERLC
ncbi:hypothetical protein CDD81_4329 [Ophiocordyceps australis]|uniref:Secreted protein n=1 Tax=Ophiocordyceps australis TaxID=1399860 RepID=A0A2C5YAQ5_9HYPO|nr:hypothetical protein CDD81_4329 [Ophiocordyceps australis]